MSPANPSWPLPGDPNETVGTRHHLLPQLLLRYFGNEREMIATVNRATGRRHVAPISDTGAERDFYTAVDEGGQLDGRSDHLLGRVEADAAPVIRQLVNGGAFARFPPPAEERVAMCWFVAFQRARGRQARRRTELLGDSLWRIMIPKDMGEEDARAWLEARGEEVTPEKLEALMQVSAEIDEIEFVPDPNAHLSSMTQLALATYQELLARRWYIIEYAEPSLVTCDEPVILAFDQESPPFRGLGLNDASEVSFPLSPRHLLVLAKDDRYGHERRIAAAPETAREVNVHIAANAYESIYMHPDQDHLAGIELPEPQGLFQVHASGVSGLERYNKRPERTKTQRRK